MGWNYVIFEVPSNPGLSVIICMILILISILYRWVCTQPPGPCKWMTFNPCCTRACLKLSYKYYNKLIRVDIFKPINFDVIIMLVFITQQTEQWILNSFCFIYIKCQYLKIDSLSSRKVLPVVSFCRRNLHLGMSLVQFLLGCKFTRASSGCDSKEGTKETLPGVRSTMIFSLLLLLKAKSNFFCPWHSALLLMLPQVHFG